MNKSSQFLKAVLGEDGFKALTKSVEDSPALAAVLVPRAVIGWLAVTEQFSGCIPGSKIPLKFAKSEEGFDGQIGIEDEFFNFEAATQLHLAAAITVALGVDRHLISVKDTEAVKLAKSIDVLAKAKTVLKRNKLKKLEPHGPPAAPKGPKDVEAPEAPTATQRTKGPTVGKTPSAPKPKVDANPSTPSISEHGKQAQTEAQQKQAKTSKPTKVKVAKSLNNTCEQCGLQPFLKDKLTGCLCSMQLAKRVKLLDNQENWELDLSGLDEEEQKTFLKSLGL